MKFGLSLASSRQGRGGSRAGGAVASTGRGFGLRNGFKAEEDEGQGEQPRMGASLTTLQRAAHERANAVSEDKMVFDYDGWKGSGAVGPSGTARVGVGSTDDDSRQSRYVVQLLATSKQREEERNMAYERKRAREDAEADEEGGPTERFVTGAYRERMAQLAAAEAAERAVEEAERAVAPDQIGAGAMEAFAAAMMFGASEPEAAPTQVAAVTVGETRHEGDVVPPAPKRVALERSAPPPAPEALMAEPEQADAEVAAETVTASFERVAEDEIAAARERARQRRLARQKAQS
jgi:hypothetical protein